MRPNYPVTEQVGTAFKLRQRMENLPSCAHVLHKTLNSVISRFCLAEHGEEMYQNLKRTCSQPLFFSLNPIVLSRCRCRRRSSFLNSLIVIVYYGQVVQICCLSQRLN